MGGFREKLTNAGTIGIDTSIFIYQIENNSTYGALTKIIFEGMEVGKFLGITSTITVMELTVLPWRMGYENVAREYETILANFPNLSIMDIDRNVARLAAKLRADFNISPADALQVSASLQGGARAFLTNNKKLSALQPISEILLLDDFTSK